jgi:hypothetical protein
MKPLSGRGCRTFFWKYCLGLALLGWIFWQHWDVLMPQGEGTGIQSVFNRPIDLLPFCLACVLSIATAVLGVARWFILVRVQRMALSFTKVLQLGMIGIALNSLVPGTVGGDLIKVALIGNTAERRTRAVATVLIDRLIGLCGLIWLFTILGCAFWITGSLPNITGDRKALGLFKMVHPGFQWVKSYGKMLTQGGTRPCTRSISSASCWV